LKSSFPLVSNISPIPTISYILSQSEKPLPLKNIANNITRNNNPGLLKELFKSLKINPDILSLMTDLNIITDVRITDDISYLLFPSMNINLLEYCGDIRRIKLQCLTNLGRDIAQAYALKDCNRVKCLTFFGFLSNQKLPSYFKDIIQNKEIISKEVQITSLMELTHMKGPDARNLVEWSKWLEINVSYENSLVLDRYEIIYKIVNSVIYFINNKLNNENLFETPLYFYEIRKEIIDNFGLDEINIRFDVIFRLILDFNTSKISFAPARIALLGGEGFECKNRFSIITISEKLDYVPKKECKLYSSANAILVG